MKFIAQKILIVFGLFLSISLYAQDVSLRSYAEIKLEYAKVGEIVDSAFFGDHQRYVIGQGRATAVGKPANFTVSKGAMTKALIGGPVGDAHYQLIEFTDEQDLKAYILLRILNSKK
jgi:hypothetical protein